MPEAQVVLGEGKIPVGRLVFEHDGRRSHSTFLYDRAWLENPRGFDLSPQMPRAVVPYTAATGGRDSRKQDVIAGPFSDSSPDSWGRKLMRRVLGEGATEFDFLICCDDTARQGALRFLDDNGRLFGTGGPPVPRLMDLEELRAIAARFEADPAGAEDAARELVGAAGSLGGARPKANLRDGADLWIAKFTSINDTWPVERLEIATLKLARDLGLRAPDARLALPASERPVALIRRFDRRAIEGRPGRIPYISARTALGHVGGGTGSYTDIADAIRAISVRPADDMRELWCRMLFGILCTNTDDHLKNHGFIYAGNNLWRLSPLFDVNPQPRRHPQLETAISPIHGHEPAIEAAIEAAPFFDLDETEARQRARDMAVALAAGWRDALRREGITGPALAACAPAFEHDRLEAALAL
ncbi:type II toxin-antitoxin system HipA family toxin (plasmid) [Cereibacter azotoformans]|uniref:Type II toxin-antitoxin system HipA family toxin n=1 Tax=Cereibacter sphaeroides (strain ATCC 17025 / ATH 2.4.3) TaxID=349102 RepID=A4X086_CERS5|nr:type II toxin-antitoxin system HipA family toxin [Cereibacter azotoformans]AXQ96123.1 type II toxin-antitoxin system HipA family toxin [Cereibacter sphaeroides]UIJ32960.1 type II toxin-antitoxin system HipA family toxin [Cereibacter azotoformans]